MITLRSSVISIACALMVAALPVTAPASPFKQAQYRQQIDQLKNNPPKKSSIQSQRAPATFGIQALVPAGPQFSNGGFESGDFSGWIASDNGRPGLVPWRVAPAGNFGSFNTQPREGTMDAYNGFDGEAGYEAYMIQDVYVPSATPALSFYDRIQFDSLNIPSMQPRVYEVQVRDPNTNTILGVLHHQEVLLNGMPKTDLGWVQRQLSLHAYIGQVVRIHVQLNVPESWTGPAQIEFDDFRLINMPPPADISGCFQEGGKPVAGHSVLMYERYMAEQRTVTDSKGCYTFQRVQPGNLYDIILPSWMP